MDGIATNILYIAGICGGLVTIGGFVAKMTKPHTDLKETLTTYSSTKTLNLSSSRKQSTPSCLKG